MRDHPAGNLTFRQGLIRNSMARFALADLLSDIFAINVTVLETLGGFDPTCVAFSYVDAAGLCVANFSLFSMPMIIEGQSVRAAGFQSGAVRPNWRGKGLYRDLMGKAFAFADDEGFEAGLLLTGKPGLYTPFGFQTVPEYVFAGPPPEKETRREPARAMSFANAADVTLARTILEGRMPVSNRFAVARQMEMFLLNSRLEPDIRISWMPEQKAIIAWRSEADGCLTLLDVAAPAIPSLATILAALRLDPARVEVRFPTDRLAWTGVPQPNVFSNGLMIRWADAARLTAPVMLSPMAAF